MGYRTCADRQKFVDQAQSVNVFFRPDADIKYLHAVHYLVETWIKNLYYCRSEKIGKADRVYKRIERQIIKELDVTTLVEGEECIACEG